MRYTSHVATAARSWDRHSGTVKWAAIVLFAYNLKTIRRLKEIVHLRINVVINFDLIVFNCVIKHKHLPSLFCFILLYRVRRKDLFIEKTVLIKNGKTYRLQNFKVYVEMYSNHNCMHKLGYFRPRFTWRAWNLTGRRWDEDGTDARPSRIPRDSLLHGFYHLPHTYRLPPARSSLVGSGTCRFEAFHYA